MPMFKFFRDRRSRAAMLMYHRVVDVPHDPWGMAVSPGNFAEQLRLLKRHRTLLSTDEFIGLLDRDALPRDAVAITFDDGYLDNLRYAAPALAAEQAPATLFLTTAPMHSQQPYWYEELSAMILDAPEPAEASLQLPDGEWIIRFGAREALDDARHGWRAWDAPRTAREAAYADTWNRLRPLPPHEKPGAMARLREQLPGAIRPIDRPMTAGELAELVAPGWFTLGGHTLDHPDLPELDDAAAVAQIAGGKAEAEAVAGAPVAAFAYPYGRFDARVRGLVQKAGFDWACTTQHGYIRASRHDRFALPRVAADDSPDIDWLG